MASLRQSLLPCWTSSFSPNCAASTAAAGTAKGQVPCFQQGRVRPGVEGVCCGRRPAWRRERLPCPWDDIPVRRYTFSWLHDTVNDTGASERVSEGGRSGKRPRERTAAHSSTMSGNALVVSEEELPPPLRLTAVCAKFGVSYPSSLALVADLSKNRAGKGKEFCLVCRTAGHCAGTPGCPVYDSATGNLQTACDEIFASRKSRRHAARDTERAKTAAAAAAAASAAPAPGGDTHMHES